MSLHSFIVKRRNSDREFMASCFGAEIQKSKGDDVSDGSEDQILFGDPEDYKDMSEEEREELTIKMMPFYKQFASEKFVKGNPKGKDE